jgi:TolA-binding protein
VLKGSTSKLIANDALELSTFITDNLGLDTIKAPLRMYATAELYLFQHKYDEAYSLLDTILSRYPKHSLTDDIYFKQAEIRLKEENYFEAATLLENVVELDPSDILADEALFKLAKLYDNQLQDKERAKELYKRLILEYNDSIYAVHARKRFRALRGDNVN